ncbi:hypothetical protein B1991_00500 [Rhodanobacter lindaniclasticus]|uniref:Uncharacterized protein n=1 Tax=Rhodanobacter lindaniclasticus TaxID=75310 RepID=A0A4S3KN11_9GAMM|nr:hypothetical protein B1991_00500 [Rhodanobacter lindaniclasticus]
MHVAGHERMFRVGRDQPVLLQTGPVQRLEHAGLAGTGCATALQHQGDGAVVAGYRLGQRRVITA